MSSELSFIGQKLKLVINIYPAADKTTNFYKLDPATYNDLLEKNITKSYKKAEPETTRAIRTENKNIATRLGIDDRVDATANKEAFITLKDHKPNFANKPTCRLINPTKSEIGKVSKTILDRINNTIARKCNFNQWKNTASVIDWFNATEGKKHSNFICFDIEEFYPSISQDLLNKALDFASAHENITADERNIITHAKNSILIHKQQPWQKKGNTAFDVTMGSFDGAETCELVGSFLLSQLQHLDINVGLYRDDGLAITNASPRDTENTKREICRIFNSNGLRITIEANKQIINFLDVTFSTLTKIRTDHSPNQMLNYYTSTAKVTTRQLQQRIFPPALTNDFHSCPPTKHHLIRPPLLTRKLSTKADTSSPCNMNPKHLAKEKTDSAAISSGTTHPSARTSALTSDTDSSALVDKHFPKDHKLHKIANRNTIKISYSCMNSTKRIIDNHKQTHPNIFASQRCRNHRRN